MAKNKTTLHPKPPVVSLLQNPNSLEKIVAHASQYTFIFARLRPNKNSGTDTQTLGTAFLAGKNRMVTCSHCIFDPRNSNIPMLQHQDGDSYLFVQRSQSGASYRAVVKPELNKSLYTFPGADTAIFYLPDEFYRESKDGKWFRNPSNHLIFNKEMKSIGATAGLLGYPMVEIQIDNTTGEVDPGNILIRADQGVVNTVYMDGANHHIYEFTMAFNPGNSGGPIFDLHTGTVIGLVHGFNSFLVNTIQNGDRVYSSYSLGVGSECIKPLAKPHELSFSKN